MAEIKEDVPSDEEPAEEDVVSKVVYHISSIV